MTVLAVALLGGCGSGSPAATTTPPTTGPGSTSGAPATSAPAGTAALPPAAGGGAKDFCAALKEYRSAIQEDTAAAEGGGFRAAATDLRTFAPAEIKAAVGLAADVIDEVGLSILAGNPPPELISQGQSRERIKALSDVFAWETANCKS
ncbi:MAG: hypothetical protein HYX55_09990 [Chloroflexi bacterium]|nr:hypothetical protein [Chloroflexota bacterium]